MDNNRRVPASPYCRAIPRWRVYADDIDSFGLSVFSKRLSEYAGVLRFTGSVLAVVNQHWL